MPEKVSSSSNENGLMDFCYFIRNSLPSIAFCLMLVGSVCYDGTSVFGVPKCVRAVMMMFFCLNCELHLPLCTILGFLITSDNVDDYLWQPRLT